jgi:uncharacterized protein YwgA
MVSHTSDWEKAAGIIRDAGGRIVGRTRLQKVAYLLELAGLGEGFQFDYRHYGPYSEDLAEAIQMADAFGLVREEERRADWGGVYSIYTATERAGRPSGVRADFAEKAAQIGAIELELAATAAYLSVIERCVDPWVVTKRLKAEKAGHGRLQAAKQAYRQLQRLRVPKQLPDI